MTSILEPSLESSLHEIARQCPKEFGIHDILQLLDLTLLNANATAEELHALSRTALQQGVAAICVLPQHLEAIPPMHAIKRATVANFPTGNQAQSDVLHAIEEAITRHHADEIDYVFPYQAYWLGETAQALQCYREVYHLCKQHRVICKAILETGALPSLDVIYRLSLDVLEIGCDFLKTSTGKIPIGATLPAAHAILSALASTQSTCGIKLSGGIKTLEQAIPFIQLAQHMLNKKPNKAWFRIGSSGLSS